jgi:hypothetical protein
MIAGLTRSTRRTLLPLLPSGPDGVHTPPLHRARLSIFLVIDTNVKWRREGDSNPRYTFVGIHTISSRAPSAARTSLHHRLVCVRAFNLYAHGHSEPGSLCACPVAGNRENRIVISMAERGGFEPPWGLLAPKSISSRSRYDHFGTSPHDLIPKWVAMLSSFP